MSQESVNPYQAPASDLELDLPVVDTLTLRKQLVPKWIKFFGWIFIVLGVVAPLGYLAAFAGGTSASFSLLGLEVQGGDASLMGLFVVALFISFGISAYGLLFGRDWGVNACLGTGYLGLAVSVVQTIAAFYSGVVMIRLEPLVQVPYLIKLHKIRPQWNRPGDN